MDSSITNQVSNRAGVKPEPVSLRPTAAVAGPAQPAQAAAQRQQAEEPAATERVRAAVEKLNDYVQVTHRDLQFSLHEETGMTVVTVVDSDTQEVIRQIPAEEILAIAEHLEEARGLLFRAKV